MADLPQDATMREVTHHLQAWGDGDSRAEDALLPLIYDELRRMAQRCLVGEKPSTLQPTALVHEAYLRLVDQKHVDWQGRKHFFGVAASMMRRVLIDHVRSKRYAKRGGDRARVPLATAAGLTVERAADLLALDDALADLARIDPDKASIVELRFFGGLSLDATAEVLGCSRPTVVRHWRLAKGWLLRELES
ncbi:MAG: sigma-70 family RNA polymerase sigma factor [Acidobacteriota bacterium]